jgi:AcrR family transcriptional regulator
MKSKIAAKSDPTHPKHQNESTRERVVQAAFRLFCEHGFSGDGMNRNIATP